jgi:hypothetical protein
MQKRCGGWLVLLAAMTLALQGCTVGEVKQTSQTSAPPAPQGWQQTGTMTVNGQVVPVYSETYRGEGQSPYQMALNPQTGKIQAFQRDEVGNVLWRRDPMEP